ncbi:MAG: PKD domain-containing protein, partial [ANME-2 cluster archaeon]|nr:PKD domain-containing protein [ANME-2 cluster archaeon]
MNGKGLDKVLVTTLFIFFIVAPLVSAELIPHGIKGTVYLSDGVTPAPRGTNFSINDTTSGYYLEGLTGGPSLPGDPFSGFYSASIVGEDGDEVIIKAWNATYYGITVITLAGDMAEIDVIINTPLQDINQPPVSDPNGPYTDTEGVSVTFDGSGSSDPDGSIDSYDWDFGDGNTGTGVNPVHAYTQDGPYTVTLTVTDNNGATDTDTTTATISDTEPVADFTATPVTGAEPLIVDFTDTSTSYDGITTWEWDFDNDGTADSTEQNPTHTYIGNGTYSVTLNVSEADGNSDSVTKLDYITVTLGSTAPVITITSPSDGSTVPVTSVITVTFDESMNTASVEDA